MSKCILPFSHSAIMLNDQIQPCCNWSHKHQKVPSDFSLSDPNFFHHPFLQDIRKKMLRGEKVNGCERCYLAEQSGVKSMRQSFSNEKSDVFSEELYDDPKIVYLDISVSNTCNNRCRMCDTTYSTRWYKDSKKIDSLSSYYSLPPKGITRQKFEHIDVSSLKYLKILGGEPLMEQDVLIDILKRTNLKDLEVNIITNGTLIPNEKLNSLLQQCRKVIWSVSIDAYGTLNDFLRKDSVWSEVDKNLKWFISYYAVHVHSVVSVYNSNKLNELKEYLDPLHVTSNYNVVSGKEWMQPRVLDDDTREWVLSHYETDSTEYKTLNKYFEVNPYDFSYSVDFYKTENAFNKIRNEDWKDYNPELHKVFYENIGLL